MVKMNYYVRNLGRRETNTVLKAATFLSDARQPEVSIFLI